MKLPAPADLQRWSEDVAHDAASLSFLPLARAYRKQGRRDAALRLCLRGLEHNPSNIEAHALLAVLYFESGYRLKAYDEWSMVLTLDPDNFDALRGMGFYYLEQEDYNSAQRHLARAAELKPHDPAVREGMRVIQQRSAPAQPAAAAASMEPWQQESVGWGAMPGAASPATVAAPAVTAAPASTSALVDPSRLFEPIMRGGQLYGALLLDAHGLVIAGSLGGDLSTQAESLGAILGGAIEEAVRTVAHLSLGKWSGVLLEADTALLHFAPVGQQMIVLLAAHRHAPAGWVLRSAQQAGTLATRFLEASS
jgi:tetratricopeptide (TPR) repeat protein